MKVESKQLYGFVYREEGIGRIMRVNFLIENTSSVEKYIMTEGDLIDAFCYSPYYYFLEFHRHFRNKSFVSKVLPNNYVKFSRFVYIPKTKARELEFKFVWISPEDLKKQEYKFIIEYNLKRLNYQLFGKVDRAIIKGNSRIERQNVYYTLIKHKQDFDIDILSCKMKW